VHPERPHQRGSIQQTRRLPAHHWRAEGTASGLAFLRPRGPVAAQDLPLEGKGGRGSGAGGRGVVGEEGKHLRSVSG